MPYIKEGLRKELMTEPRRAAENVGAMNYLFSEAILKIWNANPKYETIHKLKLVSSNMVRNPLLNDLVDVWNRLIGFGANDDDAQIALELAFQEFYLRIGQFYEREKRQENGDLPGYEEAIKHLNELAQTNFNNRIGFVPKESK